MEISPIVNAPVDLPRYLREARGLSQADLAKLIGTTPGFVSMCEAGKRRPSLDVALLWRRHVGLPVSYWQQTVAAEPEAGQ